VRRRWDATAPLVRYLDDLIPALSDVDQKDQNGRSPFHNVFRHSSIETARRWIEQGANPFQKDNNGETPLEFATRWGRDLVVRYLSAVRPHTCDSCKREIPSQDHTIIAVWRPSGRRRLFRDYGARASLSRYLTMQGRWTKTTFEMYGLSDTMRAFVIQERATGQQAIVLYRRTMCCHSSSARV
jgi:hypothetical protein